ncbi:MAG: MoaD/ThiS family protein [Betaproteobacteria bacterium]|jgi:molybdopterin synthase sulfur carrier subunit|nr:MoaD/ThiS family protein [Betaproteobacteria bacterium]MBP6645933.1 MoaD/ThiS family protein [Burkholderiaceae bacterium]
MSKSLTIRYFASIRETMGCSAEQVTSHANTIGELRTELVARGNPSAQCLGTGRAVRMALNQVMVDDATVLPANAEVAFFPPVTGG